jgi:hypothetical protein
MTRYPKISNEDFYKKVSKLFKKFKIKDKRLNMDEICYPSKFKLQLPQQFVSEFMTPSTPYKGLLLFHQIGAGKTCAAVSIAENFKGKKNILVVTPASLMGNFYKELRSECTGDEYLKPSVRKEFNKLKPSSDKYKEIIKKVNKKIDKYYTVLSYNKFVEKIQKKRIKLNNTLLIIDEVQNVVSEHGSFYKAIYGAISKAPDDLRVVLLSGTPIFDKPLEIGLTLNLLKLKEEYPKGSKFNDKFLSARKLKSGEIKYKARNLTKFKELAKGYISYYRGAPPVAFPKKNIKIVNCKMSDYQYKSYKTVATDEGPFRTGDILKLPNNFFIGSRLISNIAFPKKGINQDGYDLLAEDKLLMTNLKKFSIKFYKILKQIKQSDGPVFIYSNFKEYGGLKSFIKVLEHHNFVNYKDFGEGEKRYAVWSSDEKHEMKEELKDVYNQFDNADGSKLKVILGSPSIKEGVSLLRVSEVHIMEPYWNLSRLEQVIGRAVRFCSHKDLAKRHRHVDIYIYIADHPKEEMTIDKYILNMAYKKNKIVSKFEMALKESAVDCKLNYYGNVYNKKDEHIECDI